jgi:branched-chain amino acid transport system substrate-binding protein
VDAKLVGSPGLAVQEYANIARQGADGVMTVAAWVPNATSNATAWVARMKSNDPDALVTFGSAENYDGAMIAFEAMKSAKGLDPASVRNALASIKGYKGIAGTYSFDERGDGLHDAQVVRWEGGEMRPLSVSGN